MTKKVLVVGGDALIERMFVREGWTLEHSDSTNEVSLVVFTGGGDIDPKLYGERNIRSRGVDVTRDKYESRIFDRYQNVPKVGICRGGQFLNVMSGGKMYQHVDAHLGDHEIHDLVWEEPLKVTSTHHQMMRPRGNHEIIAFCKRASVFVHDKGNDSMHEQEVDPEVVWYPDTKSLCFQPHPEYNPGQATERYFFDLLKYFFDY